MVFVGARLPTTPHQQRRVRGRGHEPSSMPASAAVAVRARGSQHIGLFRHPGYLSAVVVAECSLGEDTGCTCSGRLAACTYEHQRRETCVLRGIPEQQARGRHPTQIPCPPPVLLLAFCSTLGRANPDPAPEPTLAASSVAVQAAGPPTLGAHAGFCHCENDT